MKEYKDFKIARGQFPGTKVKMDKVIGKQIAIFGFSPEAKSSYNSNDTYITIQFCFADKLIPETDTCADEDLHIVFTSSKTLAKILPQCELPFLATITRRGKYYELI